MSNLSSDGILRIVYDGSGTTSNNLSSEDILRDVFTGTALKGVFAATNRLKTHV